MKKDNKYNIQVSKKHYLSLDYDSKGRWISYWYQISEVLSFKPKNVLEIGVGNRTVSDYLKKLCIRVTTCDFDKNLKPDVIADILNLPFKKNSFDVVLCAEVLEHIPFENFSRALAQIHKVTKKAAVITVPHFSITNLYFGVKLIPFIPKKEFLLKVDVPIKHKFLGEHYWEIGKKGYTLSRIKTEIKNTGLKIKRSFYPVENPYHHFFLLKKA